MCRTDSKKAMKCVPFVVNVCTCEMLMDRTHFKQSMKLRIMIINIKTKVLIKCGASDMMCVELRAKKL